jgi:hypothetical protein
MRSNIKLAAAAAALYAALVAILIVTPARAGIVEDPVTHFRTYVPDPPIGTYGGPGISFPAPQQPPWIAPPATRLEPPQRFQTTCYLIGNILECY